MTEQSVGSVAQTILAMSHEDRRALALELSSAGLQFSTDQFLQREGLEKEAASSASVNGNTKVQEDGAALPAQLPDVTGNAIDKLSEKNDKLSHQESLRSFFEQVKAFQIEGPKDWASNIDDYLQEDVRSQHE